MGTAFVCMGDCLPAVGFASCGLAKPEAASSKIGKQFRTLHLIIRLSSFVFVVVRIPVPEAWISRTLQCSDALGNADRYRAQRASCDRVLSCAGVVYAEISVL